MANPSIKAAFERFWQHVIVKLSKKPDIYYGTSLDDAPTDVPNGTIFILYKE